MKGHYSVDHTAGPFQGPNWTGQFQLRVVGPVGNRVFLKLNLPAWQYTLFMHRFKIAVADYNGDGYPDFALGQYLSSNANQYQVFSIGPDGIRQLHVSTGAVFGPPNAGYSPEFSMVTSHAFTTTVYDNADGKWFKGTYTWVHGKFVPSQTEVALHPQPTPPTSATPTPGGTGADLIPALGRDSEQYWYALQTVDLFLGAWLAGDVHKADSLMAPGPRKLLQSTSGTAFFLTTAGHPTAYEVIGSRQLSPSEYEFDVWLYAYVVGAYGPGAIPRGKPFVVTVRQTSPSGNWLMLNIPGFSSAGN